jgi:hypothetical protein
MIMDRDTQEGTEVAWHKLTIVKEKLSLKEDCGIRYPMVTIPLSYTIGDKVIETESKQIVSLDDGLPVGNPVSSSYGLISNEMMLDMIGDALSGTQHEIVSLGTVCDRAKAFVSIKLSDDIVAAGRLTKNVLNIMWGHGGLMSVIGNSGLTVVVCQNTLNVALSEKGDFRFTIKHTKFAADRLGGMSEAIDRHCGVVAEFQHAMDSMEAIDCEEETARAITAGILTPSTFERDTKVSTRTINMVDKVVSLYRTGAGNKGKTMADLFNGATDYFTHESSGGEDPWKQFVSSEFGSAADSKRQWFNTLSDDSTRQAMKARGRQILLVA